MFCMGITELREEFWQGSTSWVFGSVAQILGSIGSCGSVTVKIVPGLLLWAFSLSPSCFLFL